MRIEDKALAVGVLASVASHVAFAAVLPLAHARAGAGLDPREVEFTVSLPTPPPDPEPDAPIAPAPTPVSPRPARERPAPSTPSPPSGGTIDLGPATPDALEGAPPDMAPEIDPADDEEARRRRAALLDLSPEAVARAGVRLNLPSGPVDPEAGRRTGEQARGEAFYGERGHALSAGLARDTARRPTGRRPPPDLRRRTDGSYRWEGPLVTARIAPDGSVSFDDGPGVSAGLGEGGSLLGGRFDLNDAIERGRGNDPRAAEKRWFLRETRGLRDRLAASALDERLSLAERRLVGRLRAIWGDLDVPADTRRVRIFRLWDGLAEDEVGARARAAVERFVRDELAAGSEHAFTPAELASLNRRRASERPFAPYR